MIDNEILVIFLAAPKVLGYSQQIKTLTAK